ncbi:hypothetical protein [Pseudolactococcus piscium]|uniref:Uncharacterized protein n=1 Tax=Pseudolactococcus piscium MKFS47 TaxID=297352 RepID=A0A0D6DU53_9LACT|nr:hypothetical protein [Lactococcus piscium]CEN27248.1 Uncharacterized protein LACPI_0048 [Lactococcus piscium MKFS47]
MKIFFVVIILVIILYVSFNYLLAQSKKPTGIIGSLMMKIWNNAYLPMTEWSLSFLDKRKSQIVK